MLPEEIQVNMQEHEVCGKRENSVYDLNSNSYGLVDETSSKYGGASAVKLEHGNHLGFS